MSVDRAGRAGDNPAMALHNIHRAAERCWRERAKHLVTMQADSDPPLPTG